MNKQLVHYQNKLDFEIDPSDLYAAMNRGEQIRPLDTRKEYGYDAEHIPGAINIPHAAMTEENTRHLNKDILYVTYCDGVGCNASTKGAINMTRLGFKVKELMGGIQWWKLDGYATEGEKASQGLAVQCAC
jgi:rhodanese-related sulfurtransferase